MKDGIKKDRLLSGARKLADKTLYLKVGLLTPIAALVSLAAVISLDLTSAQLGGEWGGWLSIFWGIPHMGFERVPTVVREMGIAGFFLLLGMMGMLFFFPAWIVAQTAKNYHQNKDAGR